MSEFDEKAAHVAALNEGYDSNAYREHRAFEEGAKWQFTQLQSELGRKDTDMQVLMDKCTEHVIALEAEQAKNVKLREALESMHIDDCAWDIDKLDIKIARGWHKSNNGKIENALKESGDE